MFHKYNENLETSLIYGFIITNSLSLDVKYCKFVSMKEQIWQMIAALHTPGFFITAEMGRVGTDFPTGLESFIGKKLKQIQEGITSRRFVYQESDWRIYLTFFPTDRVVDERYALKNKVVSRYAR